MKEPRTEFIRFRVTEREKEFIRQMGLSKDKNISEIVRRRLGLDNLHD